MRRGRRGGLWIGLIAALASVCAVGVLGWAWPRLFPDALAQGTTAYNRRDWQRAQAKAVQILRAEPGREDALRLLARSSARQQQDDRAQSIYQRLGSASMEGEDYYLLAAGLVRMGELTGARTALEEARNRAPKHAETLAALTWIYAARWKDFQAAAEVAQDLSQIDGWQACGSVIQGIVLTEFKEYDRAASALALALERDPSGSGYPSLSSFDLKGDATTRVKPNTVRKLLARCYLHLGRAREANRALDAIKKSAIEHDLEYSWLSSRMFLQLGDSNRARLALDRSEGWGEASNPLAVEPAPFVGSAACARCHQAEHHSQQQTSRHSKTLRKMADAPRFELPAGPIKEPCDPRIFHTITYQNKQLSVRTNDAQAKRELRALADYALGSGDKGITLVGSDQDGKPRELRLSYYSGIKGWDITTGQSETPKGHDGFSGKPLTEEQVRRCLHCHATSGRAVMSDQGIERFDHAIGCERCHGPGGNHIKAVETKFPALAIARPNLASTSARMLLCAQCHAPSGVLEPAGFDPTLERYIRNQSSTLRKSRCFTESNDRLDCMTCHNPHKDAESRASYYDTKCLKCHASEEKANPPTTPAQVNDDQAPFASACRAGSKAGCVSCHMPQVKSDMKHSLFTDHYIRVRQDATGPEVRGPRSP